MSFADKDLLYFEINKLRSFSRVHYQFSLDVRYGGRLSKDLLLTLEGRPEINSLEQAAEILQKDLQSQLMKKYTIENGDFSLSSLNLRTNGMIRALAENTEYIDTKIKSCKRILKFRNYRNTSKKDQAFEFDCFNEPIIIQEIEKLGIPVNHQTHCHKIDTFRFEDVKHLSKDKLFRTLEKQLLFESAELLPEERLLIGEALTKAKEKHQKKISLRKASFLVILLLVLSGVMGGYSIANSNANKDRQAWADAKRSNSPQKYLDEYPNGHYTLDAKKMLDKDSWETAIEKETDYFLYQYIFSPTGHTKYYKDSALNIIRDPTPLTEEEIQAFVGKKFSGYYEKIDRTITFEFKEYKQNWLEGRILQSKSSTFQEIPVVKFHILKQSRVLSIINKPFEIPTLKIYKKDETYFMETKSREDPYLRLTQ